MYDSCPVIRCWQEDPETAATQCFTEPVVGDPTPARDDESRGEFLRRSTWARAAAMRDFYNLNLAELPTAIGEQLCKDLHSDRTVAKHFELVVGRFPQILGATTLEYELGLPDGHRIDWHATFTDGAISVEATLPTANTMFGDALKAQRLAVDMIVRQVPRGWWVIVHHVPAIGPNESLQPLRKLVATGFAEAPAPRHELQWSFTATYGRDRVEVDLIGRSDSSAPGAYGGGPAVAGFDNTSTVLHRAIEGKRRQVRNAPRPVLLAMATNGFRSHDVDDFDRAVLGEVVWNVDTGATYLRLNGALGPVPVGREPAIAGVLAFAELGMTGGPDPILYVHPRYHGPLPSSVSGLRRRFAGAISVEESPPAADGRLMTLGWPTGREE